jgi:branched-chain amino acid transport system ATP-binding protein
MDGVTAPTSAPDRPQPDSHLLQVEHVSLAFGGVRALVDVSLTVSTGEIRAVIGPNGAGKSTLFNVLSGLYRPQSGSVRYLGAELTRLRPDQIASRGVARTFQNLALFPNLTVEDNLMLGRHHLTGAGFVATGLSLPGARREDRRHRARVQEIAEFLDLGRLLRMPARVLAYGDQKRVDLARALCTEPALLLLDEPVAGMGAEDRERMAATIIDIRTSLDLTVIVVEHDMGLVMGISDCVTVLDFGRRIAEGTCVEVQNDPTVIAAYLGDPEHATPALSALEASS